MSSLNRVTLIGRLGEDPSLQYTQGGTAIANLSLATDESYTRDDGTEVDQTEWHDVTVFGRQAETTNEYTSKGSQVCVQGKLQTSEYEDRDGVTRYSTDVIAKRVLFLSGGNGGGGKSEPGQRSSHAPGSNVEQPNDEEAFEPDDQLPFS